MEITLNVWNQCDFALEMVELIQVFLVYVRLFGFVLGYLLK